MTGIVSSPHITQFRARLPPSTQHLQVSFRQFIPQFIPKVSPRRIYGVARELSHASKNRGILAVEIFLNEPVKYVYRNIFEGIVYGFLVRSEVHLGVLALHYVVM
jgi:hypothetical protein